MTQNQRIAPALTAASFALLACGCVAPLANDLSAHPQGLLPSQDTATTPKNHLELEALGLWADSERSATVALRYGLADRTEAYILQDLHRTISDPAGPDPSGIGDAWIGIRHRLIDADAAGTAHAFAAEVRLPLADPDDGLGTGELALRLSHIRDGAWRGLDWTSNSDLRLLGDSNGRPDPALGGSLTLTSPLLRFARRTLPVALLVEAGGLWHPEEDNTPGYLALGLRFPLHPSLELQVAWLEGIGGDGPDGRWLLNVGRLVGDALDLRTP